LVEIEKSIFGVPSLRQSWLRTNDPTMSTPYQGVSTFNDQDNFLTTVIRLSLMSDDGSWWVVDDDDDDVDDDGDEFHLKGKQAPLWKQTNRPTTCPMQSFFGQLSQTSF